jgi:SAM-dependent methyltransferase
MQDDDFSLEKTIKNLSFRALDRSETPLGFLLPCRRLTDIQFQGNTCKDRAMNEEKHWDSIGPAYNDEIFDVFRSDRNKRLPFYFRKHADKSHQAIDFGCGTGKSFRYLSPLFGKLLALDISNELLAIARKAPYDNISFRHADLTATGLRLPPADFAFCCNVVMLPKQEQNERMFLNIRKSLTKKGRAVLVLPSFESVLLSTKRLIDWYRKEGVKPQEIAEDELSVFKGKKRDIIQGLVQIDGVVTKHYTDPELRIMLEESGLVITALERLEYDWNTEFGSPPKWMQAPYPWDWLVECRRKV